MSTCGTALSEATTTALITGQHSECLQSINDLHKHIHTDMPFTRGMETTADMATLCSHSTEHSKAAKSSAGGPQPAVTRPSWTRLRNVITAPGPQGILTGLRYGDPRPLHCCTTSNNRFLNALYSSCCSFMHLLTATALVLRAASSLDRSVAGLLSSWRPRSEHSMSPRSIRRGTRQAFFPQNVHPCTFADALHGAVCSFVFSK